MAIEGLREVSLASEVKLSLSRQTDQETAFAEALSVFGLVEDRQRVIDSVGAEIESYEGCGRTGGFYVYLSRKIITLARSVEIFNKATFPDEERHFESTVDPKLWTPGEDEYGYKEEELDKLRLDSDSEDDVSPHVRLAVHDKGQLAHFTDQPFNIESSIAGQQTPQLSSINEAIIAYEAEGHEDFYMTALNAKALVFIALIHRIKGEAKSIPWVKIRDATLAARTHDRIQAVGAVDYAGDRFRLIRDNCSDDENSGVGISLGRKDLEVSKLIIP